LRRFAPAIGAALLFALIALLAPWIAPRHGDRAGVVPAALAQGMREVTICAGDGIYRSCRGDCISQKCFDDEAKARAESERRAKMTPEERAAEDARLAEERKAAEAERQRAAAEAAARAKAERERVAAEHKAKIDAQMQALNLPESRRKEAERLNAMREAAEKARPKPPAKMCKSRLLNAFAETNGKSQAEAMSAMMAAVAHDCQARTGSGANSAAAPKCKLNKGYREAYPPVGKCLACITEAQATSLGWVKGKGWPPPEPDYWTCSATAQCSKPLNDCGGAKVSAQ
jgi:hypothetical protein